MAEAQTYTAKKTRVRLTFAYPAITSSGQMTTTSGLGLGSSEAISPDEAIILNGYRQICAQGGGTLFLKMRDGLIVEYDCSPNLGAARVLNMMRGHVQCRE